MITVLEKFKMELNKQASKMEKVLGNIFKYVLGNKS